MDVIHKHEWEYLKLQPVFWNKYDKPIPIDDRDLAVWSIGDVVVLPKFFIDLNREDLMNHQVGYDICLRQDTSEHKGEPLSKMTTSIEARKEQIPIFEAIQKRVKNNQPVNGLVIAQPGFGKFSPYSEPILTPNGWTTMGELKIDDKVVGKNGKSINVTHIHEQGIQDNYKVTFQDGTYVNCGLPHLWTVKNRHKITNKNKGWETITTEEILKKYKSGLYKTKYGTYQQEYKYKINICEEVEFNIKEELKISSFAMGLILADGGLSQLNVAGNSIFTYADKDETTIHLLIDELTKVDPNISFKKYGKSNYQIKSRIIRDILVSYNLNGKLSIDKHIPHDYIYSSISDRRDFLKAYLLTDSYHQSKNSKVLYSSSKKLINQLQHIVRSLGIYNNKIRVKPEPKYLHNDKICIGHEAYEFMININPKKNTKTIINVELNTRENSRCITVDAKDHLYVTREFNVTHNSIVAIKTVGLLGVKSLIIVPNDILEEQFVDSIVEFTNLDKEDIGIAQGSDIENLKKKKVFDKDIVVVKIQSLYSQLKVQDLNELVELYSRFGLIIYDEAHVGTASDGYSKTGIMFKTNNVLSMTATPYRTGINDFIFKNNTGGILYQSDHQNLIPDIHLHNGIIEFTPNELNRLQFSKTDYIKFMATYNMILETKPAYFEWIANWVEYRHKQGHKTAILFATNKMVKRLGMILEARGLDVGILTGQTDKKIIEAREYLEGIDVQIFYDNYFKTFPKRKKCPVLKPIKGETDKYGVTKPILKDLKSIQATIPTLETKWTTPNNMSDRDLMKNKDTIVSNFKLLSAGFDKSELSCILFGSLIVGKVPVIQSLGRICRTHPTKIQEVQAHFMFTQIFMRFFPDMIHILVNNIKLQYPSEFTYEGFDFGET